MRTYTYKVKLINNNGSKSVLATCNHPHHCIEFTKLLYKLRIKFSRVAKNLGLRKGNISNLTIAAKDIFTANDNAIKLFREWQSASDTLSIDQLQANEASLQMQIEVRIQE